MKLTKEDVIRNSEQELIDAINGELDWEALEDIFRREHQLDIGEDIEYKRGDIVIHQGRIAYRLEFDVKVNFSLLLDREGNYLPGGLDGASDGTPEASRELTAETPATPPEATPPSGRQANGDIEALLDAVDPVDGAGPANDGVQWIPANDPAGRIERAATLAESALKAVAPSADETGAPA